MSSTLKYDEMFFEADQLIADRKIGQAMQLLYDIINEQPDYGRAHNHLGWIYETKYRDYAKAEEHYRAALAYAPEYPAVYQNYAVLLSTVRKFNDLEKLLEKAMQVPGINLAAIYNEYGIMNEQQGKLDAAIDSFKKAAQASLSEKDVEFYQGAIRRCQTKKNLN